MMLKYPEVYTELQFLTIPHVSKYPGVGETNTLIHGNNYWQYFSEDGS